ncbi:MAG: DNA-processing protein DprA [Coriobacteriia bacterium]|nr:DNA-processing protein DprA [Coriobacteriia bacterium]
MSVPASGWELRIGEPGYPACLLDSLRPPRVLYGMGDPRLLRSGLGVIGSRKTSPYGRSCAQLFAGWAAEQGVVIVSGAAMGCDHEAHRAAIDAEGPTVAVLGCGPDIDYPPASRKLLAEIREQGLVVSEQPWGTEPTKWMFPQRNRIIAALGAALLVVEAGLPSGTFSTADHAADIGRPVLVVPGSIFYPGCTGCNRLLRQGATPITEVSDLADELRSLDLLDTAHDMGLPDVRLALSPVRGRDRELALALAANPMRPDDAAYALGMDLVGVARSLAALEATGLITRYPDGRYGPARAR